MSAEHSGVVVYVARLNEKGCINLGSRLHCYQRERGNDLVLMEYWWVTDRLATMVVLHMSWMLTALWLQALNDGFMRRCRSFVALKASSYDAILSLWLYHANYRVTNATIGHQTALGTPKFDHPRSASDCLVKLTFCLIINTDKSLCPKSAFRWVSE